VISRESRSLVYVFWGVQESSFLSGSLTKCYFYSFSSPQLWFFFFFSVDFIYYRLLCCVFVLDAMEMGRLKAQEGVFGMGNHHRYDGKGDGHESCLRRQSSLYWGGW